MVLCFFFVVDSVWFGHLCLLRWLHPLESHWEHGYRWGHLHGIQWWTLTVRCLLWMCRPKPCQKRLTQEAAWVNAMRPCRNWTQLLLFSHRFSLFLSVFLFFSASQWCLPRWRWLRTACSPTRCWGMLPLLCPSSNGSPSRGTPWGASPPLRCPSISRPCSIIVLYYSLVLVITILTHSFIDLLVF